MGLIEKLEALINSLLYKLGELIWKITPAFIKNFFERISSWKMKTILFIKTLPSLTKIFVLKIISAAKSSAGSADLKAIFIDSYKKAMAQYKEKSTGSAGAFKKLTLTPFLIVAQWLQGLTTSQSLLLLAFSGGSILAVIGIAFSGQKLANNHFASTRAPASIEEIAYERPDYYKKQTKHLEVTNFRLPVYFAQVNEVKSVDIDFIATLSNRHSKMFLEKHEFQLRDHLILQIEPSVATVPLEDEGKEIIRQKILAEINDFMKLHEIEGEVLELKITYVLAN